METLREVLLPVAKVVLGIVLGVVALIGTELLVRVIRPTNDRACPVPPLLTGTGLVRFETDNTVGASAVALKSPAIRIKPAQM